MPVVAKNVADLSPDWECLGAREIDPHLAVVQTMYDESRLGSVRWDSFQIHLAAHLLAMDLRNDDHGEVTEITMGPAKKITRNATAAAKRDKDDPLELSATRYGRIAKMMLMARRPMGPVIPGGAI